MRKIILLLLVVVSSISMYAADALSGEFSVSASKKVAFSKGNLQATTTDLGANWMWGFAEHQYDYVGNAVANTKISGNGTVSENGTVDLFGWSTAATFYGISKSIAESEYPGSFVDWGAAVGDGWFTLSKDELEYLFNSRSGNKASAVAGTADARYAKATVNSVNGVIVFPDGGSFAASEFTSVASLNTANAAFTTTTCTAEQWSALEAKGCVFLPTAGNRSGQGVYEVNAAGIYWSSTKDGDETAYAMRIKSDGFVPYDWYYRYAGFSVRLVTTVPQKGDTIRYTYKGNTLYYLITARTGGSNNNVTIVKGGSTSWKEEEKPTGALVIPNTIEDVTGTVYDVTAMYESAFKDCDGITSVDFSENKQLTFVSRMAFFGCTALTSVTLSDYITYLSDYCFHGAQLTTIDLKNVQYICQYIFDYCNIAEVHIPKSVRYIFDQNRLFDHAATITCDAENPYYAAIDNVLYNKEITMIYALPLAATHDIHIPATVTSMLYQCMHEYPGTIYINSQITPTWPLEAPGDNRNSPAGDVFVGCGLYEFYTTGRYEGTTGDFGKVKSLTEQLVYTVDVKAGEHGSVNINDTTACNQVTIIAIADAHYDFVKWSNGSTDQVILLEVVSDTAIVAEFALQKFNVTVVAENGSVTAKDMMEVPVDLSQPVEYGMKLYLTATPNEGYEFDSWTNYDPATGLTVTDNVTVTATFKAKPTALDPVTCNPSSVTRKLINNGQLLIIRDGKVFNALGQEVK